MAVAERRRNGRGWWPAVSVIGTTIMMWASTLASGRVTVGPSLLSTLGSTVSTPDAAATGLAMPAARLATGAAGVLATTGTLVAGAGTVSTPTVTSTTTAPVLPAAPTVSTTTPAAEAAAAADAPTADDARYEEVGRQALARLRYPWQERLPGWTIDFKPGRAGLLGGTWTYEHRIEIYVRDGQTVDDVAFTLAHELGHAVDVTLFDDDDRHEWAHVRGLAGDAPWWVESGATDFASGAGDWAEAFAVFQVGGVSHSRVAGQPDAYDLGVVGRLSRS
jgi:hypothetical protein